MCKLLALSNILGLSVERKKKFIKVAAKILCKSDPHGFGYVMSGGTDAYAEKYLDYESIDMYLQRPLSNTEKMPFVVEHGYRFFSEEEYTPEKATKDFKNADTIILHSRYATNEKVIANTHPFLATVDKKSTYLIHNGVVTTTNEKIKNVSSTNDSELILQAIKLYGNDFNKYITGSYSWMTLDSEGNLRVCHGPSTNLYLSFISTINSWVFCTSSDIILEICDKMKWKVEAPRAITENTIIDVYKGKIINHFEFEPATPAWKAKTFFDDTAFSNSTGALSYATEDYTSKSYKEEDIPVADRKYVKDGD